MPTKKRPPKVHIKWLDRRDGDLRYAILRWTEPTGRKSRTLGFVSERAANDARADQEAALRLGVSLATTSERERTTVDDLVVHYLTELEAGAGRGTATYRRHEFLSCKRIGAHLGRVTAERLTDAHVRRMVQAVLAEEPEIPTDPKKRKHRERGVRKKSSIADLLGCLKRVYREGRDAGLVTIDAPSLPRKALAEDARPARQLTEADVIALVNAAAEDVSPAFGRLVQFLAWCPRRPVAVFALRRRDCARVLDTRLPRTDVMLYFERDKGGVGRGWSPVTEPALQALREQLEAVVGDDDALVWMSTTGRPWTSSLVASPFRRAALAAKLADVLPYDLRKFGASTIYDRVGNLKIVQEFTGHADVQQLIKRYVSAPRGAAKEKAPSLTWSPAKLALVDGAEEG